MALLAIPGGALADIVDRRRLLLATQIWAVAAASILFAASITDRISAELLLAMVFAMRHRITSFRCVEAEVKMSHERL